jgi:hypothetical protein
LKLIKTKLCAFDAFAAKKHKMKNILNRLMRALPQQKQKGVVNISNGSYSQ